MNGIALNKTGLMVIMLAGLIVSTGLTYEILGNSGPDILEIFESDLDNCPVIKERDSLSLNEFNSITASMLSQNCEDSVEIVFENRVSIGFLENLAKENRLLHDGEPIIHKYEHCNPPQGYRGIVHNDNPNIIVEREEEVNITWGDDIVLICVN